MVQEGIFKAFHHLIGKFAGLFDGLGNGGSQFFIADMIDILPQKFIRHGIGNNVHTAEIRDHRHRGMGAVQHPDLSFTEGLQVVREDNRHSGLVQREIGGNILVAGNDPETEGFRHHVHAVIREFRAHRIRLSGDDAVHQGRCKDVGSFDPVFESSIQLPESDQLHTAFLEHFAVIFDQFHRQNDQTLVRIAIESLPAFIEELDQTARIADSRQRIEFIRLVINDPGFRGVGDHIAQRLQTGQSHIGIIVGIGVHRSANGSNGADFVDDLPVLFSLQDHVIGTALCRQTVRTFSGDLLDHHYITVKTAFFICDVDHIVGKSTKKVTGSELGNTDGVFAGSHQFINIHDLFHSAVKRRH